MQSLRMFEWYLQESVLDDLELLSTLRHAKTVSERCVERLIDQQKAQVAAEATLSLYSPVSHRAAHLFQVLQQLESAHPMYLFSVQVFQQCFVEAVLVGHALKETQGFFE